MGPSEERRSNGKQRPAGDLAEALVRARAELRARGGGSRAAVERARALGRPPFDFEADRQLEAVLDAVADGVIVRDADGRTLYANEAALTALGFPSQTAVHATPIQEIPERFEIADEHGHPFPADRLPGRLALRGEESPDTLLHLRVRETGEERWVVVKARPIRDETGAIGLAILLFEDITELKQREREQRFLAESSRLLATSLDYGETLQRIARLAVPYLADWCVVDVVDQLGSLKRVALAHVDPAREQRARSMSHAFPGWPDADEGPAHVIRTGRPELWSEVSPERAATGREHLGFLSTLGLESAMVVPLLARGRTLGAITFASADARRRYAEEDLPLAQELAAPCALALDNARLYSERSYIARTLQESLLPPQLPDVEGVELAARYRPAGEGNEVGGDFYDIFETGRSGWAIVIGDVSGKGAQAAALTSLARHTVRTGAMREPRPSSVLAILNEAALRQFPEDHICTVAFGSLEPRSGGGARMVLASGGHPLPLLLRPSGEVRSVGTPGMLIGAMEHAPIPEESVELERGDVLLLYTDGVTERTPEGVFGEGALRRLLSECAGLDAAGVAERVERTVVDVQDGHPHDDIAVLVLRFT